MKLGGIETRRKTSREMKKYSLVVVDCYMLNCLTAPLANLQFCGLQQLQQLFCIEHTLY